MSRAYEFGKTEDIVYPEGIDLLLRWGHTHLCYPEDDSLLQEFEGKWEYLRALNNTLDAGFDILEEKVTAALAFLHGPATIGLEPADAEPVKTSIQTLDQIVFLAEALEFFPSAGTLSPDFQRRADTLLHQVTIDRVPPTLRLIPLNDWRIKALAHLPSYAHYLFPWYAAWTELPRDFLHTLARRWHMDNIPPRDYPFLDPTTMDVLLLELELDKPLLQWLQGAWHPQDMPHRTDEHHLSNRLLTLCESEIVDPAIPEEVIHLGILTSARRAVSRRPVSERERMETLFLTGFCTPLLEEQQRMDIFSDVGKYLNSYYPLPSDSGSLIETLYLWATDRLTDRAFIGQVYEAWEKQLAAVSRPAEAAATLTHSVTKLRRSKIPPRTGEGRFRRFYSRLIALFSYKITFITIATCITLVTAFLMYCHSTDRRKTSARLNENENVVIKRKIRESPDTPTPPPAAADMLSPAVIPLAPENRPGPFVPLAETTAPEPFRPGQAVPERPPEKIHPVSDPAEAPHLDRVE